MFLSIFDFFNIRFYTIRDKSDFQRWLGIVTPIRVNSFTVLLFLYNIMFIPD
jgi:hypothetical protein